MNATSFSILLPTNGAETTRPALEYGVWLASLFTTPVTLLGIVENERQRPFVESLVRETEERLVRANAPFHTEYDQGRGTMVIARHTRLKNFLTVVGPLNRPVWRRAVQGRSFRRLLEKVETPILYVPQLCLPLKRVLLCMGGLGFSEGAARFSLYLARQAGADITLLHIVEPVTLDYPLAREVQEHWRDILQTDTPQGRNLRATVQELEAGGIQPEIKIRHGDVVNQILEEARTGDYDLIAMGSPYSTHSLRHLYMPNVTAEVAESLICPVLTVRKGHELID